jgi:hypothetical protein
MSGLFFRLLNNEEQAKPRLLTSPQKIVKNNAMFPFVQSSDIKLHGLKQVAFSFLIMTLHYWKTFVKVLLVRTGAIPKEGGAPFDFPPGEIIVCLSLLTCW